MNTPERVTLQQLYKTSPYTSRARHDVINSSNSCVVLERRSFVFEPLERRVDANTETILEVVLLETVARLQQVLPALLVRLRNTTTTTTTSTTITVYERVTPAVNVIVNLRSTDLCVFESVKTSNDVHALLPADLNG